jgi:hypothetical protein
VRSFDRKTGAEQEPESITGVPVEQLAQLSDVHGPIALELTREGTIAPRNGDRWRILGSLTVRSVYALTRALHPFTDAIRLRTEATMRC